MRLPALSLALLSGTFVPAQACEGSSDGTVVCRRCEPAWKGVELCSRVATCRTCRGAGRVACATCKNPKAKATLLARQAKATAWLQAQRKQFAQLAGDEDGWLRKAMFCRAGKIELLFAPGKIRGKLPSAPHAQMHIYLGRLQAIRRSFLTTLSLTEADFPKPPTSRSTVVAAETKSRPALPGLQVCLIRDTRILRRVCLRATGIVHQGLGTKRFGPEFCYVAHHHSKHLSNDVDLHRHLIHNIVQLLTAQMQPTGWIGNRGYGWLDAGLAHYFEAQVDGRCENASFHEHARPPLEFFKGRWRTAAVELAQTQKLPTLRSVLGRDTSDLTPEERVLSLAVIDYLMQTQQGEKLGTLLRSIKKGQTTVDALQAVYRLSPDQLQANLSAWLSKRKL